MKKLFVLTTFFFTYALTYSYNIEIRINGQESSEIKLARYFGDKNILIDTASLDENGFGNFKGEKILQPGIYVIITAKHRVFELLIDKDNDFGMVTDTTDLFFNLQITGAEESEAFLAHQKNIIKKQKLTVMLRNALQQLDPGDRRMNDIQNKLAEVKKEIDNRNNLFLVENMGTFAAKVVKATLPVDMPQFDLPFTTPNRDSLMWVKSLLYFTSHYFDNIDLSDERLLNTPILYGKLDSYFNQVLFQQTDSITVAIDRLLKKPGINIQIKNYIIGYLLENYNKIEKLVFEDVLIHLAENYMQAEQEFYVDYKTLNDVKFKINYLEQTKLGKQAPDLKLKNVAGGELSLHGVHANYTILLFWNPDCEHCKDEMKILNEYYHQNLFSGFEVFAVYTKTGFEKWNNDIVSNDYKWINVYDPDETSGFRETYQVFYTPKIYLLDKDKKILSKSSSVIEILRIIREL